MNGLYACTSIVPFSPRTNPLWHISMACSLPLYTSRLEIRQHELFTCSAVLLEVITAFTMSSSVFIVCKVVEVPAILIFRISRGVWTSPAGVVANKHSVYRYHTVYQQYRYINLFYVTFE